ncbi:MAG: Gfo/Idh/MocA family oxidoreductase [Phycisphaerales bacterium]|nr:MAG: Gfo/Idh/MocA family oxidoreductase [Phycisphaerales bacterium]
MRTIRGRKDKALSRRDFLKGSALAAGASLAFPTVVPSSVFGPDAPSSRIAMACVGLGGQGAGNMRSFKGEKSCQIVALCDVDAAHLEQARETAGLDAKSCYSDFREVVGRDDVDAVSVGTPDHWHVPVSIAAVRAGKDVYCEKPLTLTIEEGRALADEVKRYGRVFQTGSQQRSGSEFRKACELVVNGRIGTLHTIRVGIPGNNHKCGPTWEVMPVPEGFDYDMWLGPAPWAPYTEQRCHYQFRFVLDYSGGQMTNWGAHYLDIAQWGNQADDTGPVEIEGVGDWPTTGLFTTAKKVDIEYTYANKVKLLLKTGGGNTRFEGTEGWVDVRREKLRASPESILTSTIGPNEIHLYESRDHKQNFLDCVRSRKTPIASAEIGHRSSTVCHLGNIAMLLGRKLRWDPAQERFINDAEANSMIGRAMRAPWRL